MSNVFGDALAAFLDDYEAELEIFAQGVRAWMSESNGASPTNPELEAIIQAEKRLQAELTDAEWYAYCETRLDSRELVAIDPDMRRLVIAHMHYQVDPDDSALASINASGRGRRTKVETFRFREEIYRILAAYRPMTVRQVFYQMVARGLHKTENDYARVQQEILKMRDGEALPSIPWAWIVDSTRWMRKPESYGSVDELLTNVCQTYRRDIWREQDCYVEIWCEKDALAGVLYEATKQWDVPLMVSRGFSSATFCHSAAQAIIQQDKPAYIYLFTDADKAGRNIAGAIERRLHTFAPDAEIECIRAAVTDEQIEEYNLPTRPEKQGKGRAVELDALPPGVLVEIARDCIEQHVDDAALDRTVAAEKAERETLVAFVNAMRNGDGA